MDYPVQLQDNEEVLAVIRRHPASLWGRLIGIAAILIVALIIWIAFGAGNTGTFSSFLNIAFIVVIVGCVLAALFVWYRYHNDVWMITNLRLVDSTRATPFSQQVTTAALGNVQDINIRKIGVFNTALNFGDVLCQTASAGAKTFAFRGVAKPDKVLDMIDDARAKATAK